MKLLMTADAVGGVWIYARGLASALALLGVETVIAALGPVGGLSREGEGLAVIPTRLPLDWLCASPAPVRAAADAVAALAREVRADMVHLNSPALAVARYDQPVVAVEHGSIGPWWRAAHGEAPPASFTWLADLIREGLLAAGAIVAPSASYAAEVARAYRLPHAPLAVHNGRAQLPGALSAEPAAHAFTAGRLWDRVKRTALLDRVAARVPVRAAGPVTAPNGDTVAAGHLTLLGMLSEAELAREYAARPVFVSAASFEPFGLAVLEAAQAGCPLVLSDIATFRELWDGAALFAADEAGFADAIGDLLADPAARRRWGERARVRATRYTPEANAAAMMAIYRRLLERERAAA